MIGKISGVLDYRMADHVLIDAGGVGYVVYCSERTLASLPAAGARVALFTELVVREDAMQLYGFATLAEREWHRLLMTVQGVGAKAALAILGVLGAEGVARAVAMGDAPAIRRTPGVGPKLAERVVLELKGRVPAMLALGSVGARPAMGSAASDPPPEQAPAAAPLAPMAGGATPASAEAEAQAAADALAALVHLGYAEAAAAAAVAEAAAATPEADAKALIRAALRRLGSGG